MSYFYSQKMRVFLFGLAPLFLASSLLRANSVPGPLVVLTSSLPGANVATVYSTSLAAQGGTAPYKFSVAPSSSFPASLSLSSAGTLSGTPATFDIGKYSVSFAVIDAAGSKAVRTLDLVIYPAPIIAVASGGGASGRFAADAYFGGVEGGSSGAPKTTGATVDTVGLVNPAPQKVYSAERVGSPALDYTLAGINTAGLSNLSPGTSYLVRLHFADVESTAPGQRRFNVSINGTEVLHEFDIVATATRPKRAVIMDFVTQAQSLEGIGGISVQLAPGSAGVPELNGLEVYPATVFSTQTPAMPDFTERRSYELGVRLTPAISGQFRSIRYYKSPNETGTHTGRIWSASGSILASVVFTNETPSGWQEAPLAQPLNVTAGTNVWVSVNINGYYPATNNALTTPATNGVVTATGGFYGDIGTFPTQTYENTNYYRDATFVPNPSIEQTLLSNQYPANPAANDGLPYELGVRLQAANSGQVKGIRYFRSAGDSATHVGHIWSASGALLASVTFTNETASGWQEARFAQPVAIGGGTAFIASVNTSGSFPDTHYELAPPGISNGHLQATNSAGESNGLFGPAGIFPAQSYESSDYYRDVVFVADASDTAGSQPESLFGSSAPGSDNLSDNGTHYELGLKFQSDVAGQVTAIRYWRSAKDSGTHTGHLWTATGTLLATIAFADETSSGWQSAALTTPVTIQARTTYVVSVNSNAYFPDDHNALATSQAAGHLSTVADGANGVFGTPASFPTASYLNSNYYRDVDFVSSPIRTGPGQGAYIHRGFLGWVRDLASQPRPTDQWPSLVIDDQLIADYQNAAAAMKSSGATEFEIWGLAASYSYSTNVAQTIDSTRRAQIKQIVDSLHAQGLKVVAGTGVLSWGFDQIVAANPALACPGNPHVANPTVQGSWNYQYQILDLLLSLGVDGITLQPADQGRCNCGPACDALGNDVSYHAQLVDKAAAYVRSKAPNAIIGSANYGAFFSNANDLPYLKTWAANVDYVCDVGPTAATDRSGLRPQIVGAVAPATYGGLGQPFFDPPMHWSRARYFLPTTQRSVSRLQAMYADGALAAENFMRPLANPGDEITARLIVAVETDPLGDWVSKLDELIDQIYQPTSETAHNQLRQLFFDAEDAYFNNATGVQGAFDLEPLVESVAGPPIYLSQNMSAAQRATYRATLVTLQLQAQALAGQMRSSARMEQIATNIGNVIADIDGL